jgi:hypothetical protein
MKHSAKTVIYDLSRIDPETRAAILASPKYLKWFSQKPDAMLRLDGSTKVIKGNKLGFKTAILYLAPHKMSGQNICANAALAKCFEACLKSAGRGAMKSVEMSRLRKTLFFLQYRSEALAMIKREVAVFEKRAAKQGYVLLVRLNGTSDIRWENYGVIQAYPAVQFYDYTKLSNRKNVPANYDLTFSYSGVPEFQKQVALATAAGMRMAVVFRNRGMVDRMLADGAAFHGMPVVDGDDTDIRHIDPMGSAVALYAKGAAKHDYSGFVVG